MGVGLTQFNVATKSIIDSDAIGQAIQSLSKKIVKTHNCKGRITKFVLPHVLDAAVDFLKYPVKVASFFYF